MEHVARWQPPALLLQQRPSALHAAVHSARFFLGGGLGGGGLGGGGGEGGGGLGGAGGEHAASVMPFSVSLSSLR